MAAKLFNLAQMVCSTVGTGPAILVAATSGYRTFVAAGVASGDLVSYSISDQNQHEYGVGVVTITGPTTSMTRLMTGSTTGAILALSGASIVTLTPRAEDLTTPTLTPGSWSIVTTPASVVTAVSKTLYVVTGQTAPVSIALPPTAVAGDAVAVYMADLVSTSTVTVNAGAGGAIGPYGQNHSFGVQYAFYVYRCISAHNWIVEVDPVLKPLRYKASSVQIGVIHGGSLLYMDSSAGVRTITVPADATDPLPVGFQTELMRFGANDVTLVGEAGVAIDAGAPLTFPALYSRGVLTKVNPNEWTWNLYGYVTPGEVSVSATPGRGDILYRGATEWLLLAPGTAGQVLRTNGPGADPSWQTYPATGAVTLAASPATSTVVTDAHCTISSHINLTSTTLHAANSYASLYVIPGNGSFTVYHPENAYPDRTYSYEIV